MPKRNVRERRIRGFCPFSRAAGFEVGLMKGGAEEIPIHAAVMASGSSGLTNIFGTPATVKHARLSFVYRPARL